MSASTLIWLTPSLFALFLYGIGQGLVKKYIADVSPARFCLYFVVAKAVINLGFFATQPHPPPFSAEGMQAFYVGFGAYILDGLGWILYFESIVAGPITIVGTLSAAYPATTVLFARIFLGEVLTPVQYTGITLVILGCIGLAYDPSESTSKTKGKRWILYASAALIIWGISQNLTKYSYSLPNSSEVNLALFNTMGGFVTLGVYGFLFGRKKSTQAEGLASSQSGTVHGSSSSDWLKSFLPMGMMAAGDLGVIIATKHGPVSLVTPITAAYPMVTLAFAWVVLKEKITKFQWLCIALILLGMFLSPSSE